MGNAILSVNRKGFWARTGGVVMFVSCTELKDNSDIWIPDLLEFYKNSMPGSVSIFEEDGTCYKVHLGVLNIHFPVSKRYVHNDEFLCTLLEDFYKTKRAVALASKRAAAQLSGVKRPRDDTESDAIRPSSAKKSRTVESDASSESENKDNALIMLAEVAANAADAAEEERTARVHILFAYDESGNPITTKRNGKPWAPSKTSVYDGDIRRMVENATAYFTNMNSGSRWYNNIGKSCVVVYDIWEDNIHHGTYVHNPTNKPVRKDLIPAKYHKYLGW